MIFQRHMNNILGDLDLVAVYIDGICVASPSEVQHRQHLKIVFDRLRQANLRINVTKNVLGKTVVTFLGHSITESGTSPTVERVIEINEFPQPRYANCADSLPCSATTAVSCRKQPSFKEFLKPSSRVTRRTINHRWCGPKMQKNHLRAANPT